jgi:glycosyltransferase involved in cell wall biosynthesis
LLIKREKFAIVHTHTSKAGILGRLAARMAGVPLVVHTPHGHIFSSYFSSIETRVFIWLERIWAIFTDRIITLTEGCKRDHVRLHIARPEKFVTIPSGVDPQRFSNHDPALPQHIRERLKLPLKGRIIGTVARLDPIKGIPYLLEAVKRLIPRHPDIHCVIVGDGVLRRELECFVQRLGLQPRVTFLGLQDDVPQLLSLMDVFVLPSLNEGMGRVLVEAGLMAKPIVATNVSGIPDLVTHDYTGILVAPKDSQALAEGIREMLEDSVKAQRLGQQARMRMLAGFTVQDMVAKIDALYKEVAREKM